MLEQKPFQTEGTAFLHERQRALLADDPGLGKTNQALLAAVGRTLIVTPAMLRGTWTDPDRGEIIKWRPDLDYEWVSYSSLCDRNGSRTMPWPREYYTHYWDTVIFDESHYLKNRKAKWTQAALRLVGLTPRVYLLTGTPIPNWAHELFVTLQILHPKDRAYTSYWRWIDRWFSVWTPPWGGTKITGLALGETWDSFYAGNDLDTLMLRRLREDVLTELPPLTEQTIEVEMVPAQRKVYEQMKREYHAWIEETGHEVSAWNDGGRSAKLAKITTGLESEDPKAHGSGKLDVMRELVDDMGESPLVAFCHFRNTASALVALAVKAGKRTRLIMGGVPQKERDTILTNFQRGEIDVLVGTLDTLGEGVTLTRSSTCVFVEHSWRPSRNEQAMRRLHRIGQESPVTVVHLETRDSLDQRMMAVLRAKTDEQVAALRAREVAAML